jgi:release factor glutamine methyltransferase
VSDAAAEGDVWTIRRVIAWAADDLKKRGMPSPRLDVELLLGQVLKVNRIGLVIDAERPLSKEELGNYRALHTRRRGGEPVSYLLGVREFYGRNFKVDKRVLIPRPDTETLVEVALERTKAISLSARVLDLCTGSGCVAITIARERPTMRVVASDISPGALVVARENAIRLGAAMIGIVQSDLFAAFEVGRDRFDLITANPPYIADEEIPTLAVDIHKFEPRLALSGGADGLDLVKRILADAPKFLAPGGVLAMEIGAGQSPEVMALFAEAGFGDVAARKDYGGHERVVWGVRG